MNRNVFLLPILVLGIGCSQPNTAFVGNQAPNIPANSRSIDGTTFVGYGVDPITGVVKSLSALTAKAFYSNDPPPTEAGSSSKLEFPLSVQDIAMVETASDLLEKLSWGGELVLTQGNSEVFKGTMTSLTSINTKANTLSFIVYNHTYGGYYQSLEESLSPSALAQLTLDSTQFSNLYGDAFVKRAYLGADLAYLCTYSWNQSTSEDIKTYLATFKVDLQNTFGIGGHVSLDPTSTATITKSSLSIQALTNVTNFTPNAITTKDTAAQVWSSEVTRFGSYISANPSVIPVSKKVFNPFSTITTVPNQYANQFQTVSNCFLWKQQWENLKEKITNIQLATSDSALQNSCISAVNAITVQIGLCDSKSNNARGPTPTDYSSIFDQYRVLTSYVVWGHKVYVDNWSPVISGDLNTDFRPLSLFSTRVLASQRSPADIITYHLFSQRDLNVTNKRYTMSFAWLTDSWATAMKQSLKNGSAIPLSFYQSLTPGHSTGIFTLSPEQAGGTETTNGNSWNYTTQVDNWDSLRTFINDPANRPNDLSGIILLCSQRAPSGSYTLHLFVRQDQGKKIWNLKMAPVSDPWDASSLQSMTTKMSQPLCFYQSTGEIRTRYWYVEQDPNSF